MNCELILFHQKQESKKGKLDAICNFFLSLAGLFLPV